MSGAPTSGAPTSGAPPSATSRARRRRLPDEAGIFAVMLAVVLLLCVISPAFRTVSNGFVLLVNGTVITLLALGQSFVLLTGGIDLSTGANISMTGVVAALLMQWGLPWPVASLAAVLVGVALGLINGSLVHYLRIPPFIASFSTQGVALAVPLIITGAESISVHDFGFSWLGQGRIAGVPVPVILTLVVAVAAGLFLRLTRLGVHIYAVGGNRAAARLAGVNLARTTLFVYAVSGLCAGLGGLIATSRLMVGFPSTGTGNELFYSIAAAVVGGVSLFGGVGSIPGVMIGAVLIAVVSNGMNVIDIESYWQSLVIGLIILFAVAFDTYRRARQGQPAARLVFARIRPTPVPPPVATPVATSGATSGATPNPATTVRAASPDAARPDV